MQKYFLTISFKLIKEVERFFPSKTIIDRQGKALHFFYIKLNEQVSNNVSVSYSVHSTDDKIVVPPMDSNYLILANQSEEIILQWICILSYFFKSFN
jgi:hypothetical protein